MSPSSSIDELSDFFIIHSASRANNYPAACVSQSTGTPGSNFGKFPF